LLVVVGVLLEVANRRRIRRLLLQKIFGEQELLVFDLRNMDVQNAMILKTAFGLFSSG